MSAYNKLFAAILSTLISRWLASYFSLDVAALAAINQYVPFETLSFLIIEMIFALFNGFWVWLLPNNKEEDLR